MEFELMVVSVVTIHSLPSIFTIIFLLLLLARMSFESMPLCIDFTTALLTSVVEVLYIRAGLLNGAVQYTSNGSSLVDFKDFGIYGTDGYPFGIFTDSSQQGHITNFIIPPSQVEYQQVENLHDIECSFPFAS